MKLLNNFYVLFGFIFFFSTSHLRAETLDGLYESYHLSGIIMPNDGMHECSANWSGMSGLCIQDYQATNTLGIKTHDNGDLSFAAHISFFNGHSCSLNAIARKDSTGWLYSNLPIQSDAQGATSQNVHNECELHITLDDESIIFNASENADCRFHCGARGSFYNVRFPISSRIRKSISKEDIDCIGLYSEECKKRTSEIE